MCESLGPLKKRKVEIDFRKCLLFQSDDKSEYRKANLETLQKAVNLANERSRYKDANVSEFYSRISKGGYTAERLFEIDVFVINLVMQTMETRQNEREKQGTKKLF